MSNELGLSQQAISALEQKEALDKDMLEKVASILKVPAAAIDNFGEQSTINIIANTVTNYDNSSLLNYQPTFNPLQRSHGRKIKNSMKYCWKLKESR